MHDYSFIQIDCAFMMASQPLLLIKEGPTASCVHVSACVLLQGRTVGTMPRMYIAEARFYQVAIMAGEGLFLRDPVLSHLLRHVRPSSVRHKLADLDPQRYTAAHEVVLLVSGISERFHMHNGFYYDVLR